MEQKLILKVADWADSAFDIQSKLAKTTFPEWFSETLYYALSLKYEIAGYEQGIVFEGNILNASHNNTEENFLTNLRRLFYLFANHNSDRVTVTVEKGEYVKGRPINVKVKTIEFTPKKIGTDDI